MPSRCEKCSSFELQLRQIQVEIDAAIIQRDAGFKSEEGRRQVEAILTEKLALFHQTRMNYELHRQKSHDISHRRRIRSTKRGA